jgi:hypothetical protein
VTFGLIAGSGIVLWMGVRESVRLGIVFALVEVFGLLLAIGVSDRFVEDVDHLESAAVSPT